MIEMLRTTAIVMIELARGPSILFFCLIFFSPHGIFGFLEYAVVGGLIGGVEGIRMQVTHIQPTLSPPDYDESAPLKLSNRLKSRRDG
jgi:hypothetical protein